MILIISHNEMFDDVRKHFSNKYKIMTPKEFASPTNVGNYYEDALKRLSKVDVNSIPASVGKVAKDTFKTMGSTLVACFSLQDTLTELNEKEGIKGIVTHASGGVLATALINVCNSFGVDSFVLQNGIWPDRIEKSHYCTAPNAPKHIMCGSEHMKNLYLKLGTDEEKLTITGHPYFDRYKDFVRKETDRPMVLVGFVLTFMDCRTLGPRVPWLHSTPMTVKDYFLIYEVAKRLPEFDFVIKLKQHDLLDPMYFFDSPKNVRAYKNTWFEWMDKAAVVLGDTSTVIFESAFAGVPTISPKYKDPFVDFMGAVNEIEWTVDNVVSAIKEAVGSSVDNKKFNEYYFTGNLDYNSTNRVIDFIEEKINE